MYTVRAKVRAVRKADMEVVVAVTERFVRARRTLALALLLCFTASLPGVAAVLPEDRADVLYHSYSGGGIDITGPSVMLRKLIGKSLSLFGNSYVDSITSASIDVVTAASPYKEHREEKTLGADFLHGKTTLGTSFTTSEENDYSADTARFGVSQSMFGDLTTVSLGYSRGADTVGRRGDSNFAEQAKRHQFSLGLSQVLSKNLLGNLDFALISDEGYLNNPYRQVRYVNSNLFDPKKYLYQSEVYPRTHTSHALAGRLIYYLPYRAALSGGYRFYTDSWGINAHTAELGYVHPLKNGWLFDIKYRYYQQNHADFYSDLFPYLNAQNYLARDKELSTFHSQSVGFGVSYEFARNGWWFIDKGSLNLAYNRLMFRYDDFRDLRVSGVNPGNEPLYGFDADVAQFYLSLWY